MDDKAYDASARLRNLSSAIVKLLVDEAVQALQAPDYGGLDFATYLLLDAQKYDSLYPNARAIPDKQLYDAAEKIRKWNTHD